MKLRELLPWVRRAEAEARARRAAEERQRIAQKEWEPVAEAVDLIRHQDQLNNWTGTARALFRGGKTS